MASYDDRVTVMAHIVRLTKANSDLYTIVGPLIGAVQSPEDRQRIAKTLNPQWDEDDDIVESGGIRYQPSTGEWEMENKAMVDDDGSISYLSRDDLSKMLGLSS